MVNLGGTQKVGVHASDAMTSDGKSGRYQKTRLFGHLLWWCWVGSKFLGNDILFMQAMTSDGKSGRYREKPIDSAQVRGPTLVALACTLDHGQRPAARQAAEPNASRGSCKS